MRLTVCRVSCYLRCVDIGSKATREIYKAALEDARREVQMLTEQRQELDGKIERILRAIEALMPLPGEELPKPYRRRRSKKRC